MGDVAEYLTEQGEAAWIAHLNGDCDGPCQECEAEERAARRKRRKPRPSRRKKEDDT